MINRQNWLDVCEYLNHLSAVRGQHPKTIHKYRGYLRHLLEWADSTPLPAARSIDPVFPAYLLTARNDGRQNPLSYITVYKTLSVTRAFYEHAMRQSKRYAKVSPTWVDLFQPHRLSRPQPVVDDHKYYTLEEVRAITAVPVETLRDLRAQVGVALLFLSGMRADTLASLPLQCVDLPNMRILQIPSMGPRTKNNKAAITYLLDIPDLLQLVQSWDSRLRSAGFAPSALWYAPLNHDGMQIYQTDRAIAGRNVLIRDDLARICDRLQLKYLSPHKLRHGHIVYARSFAHTVDQVKAVSQNVMHSNIIITDQIYSNLVGDRVRSVITSLGKQTPPSSENGAAINQLAQQLLALLQKST